MFATRLCWIIALTIAAERVRRRTERDEAAGCRSVAPVSRNGIVCNRHSQRDVDTS